MDALRCFFGNAQKLKTECIARKTCRTRDDARADVFDYVEPSTMLNVGTPNRLQEPHGVRVAGGTSLSGCHPHRMQANELS
jgi:Integrase core domain